MLTASPDQTVTLLKSKLQPAPAPAEREHVARLVADLDSDDFAVREKAAQELVKLGDGIESVLRQALEGKPAAETTRRLRDLIQKAQGWPPQRLREFRAVEVLERIGSQEARQLLKTLAEGAPEARLTQEAKASLERLTRRHSPKP
jgi:hypothetical protein